MTPAERKIAVDLLIEKSDRNLNQARANSALNYWDLVANRLYYSIFHAVTALMLLDGIKSGTHKGTASQFGHFYVLSGKFSREDGILYSRLQSMREKADYQNVFTLNKEDGLKLIEITSEFQNRIKSVISAQK